MLKPIPGTEPKPPTRPPREPVAVFSTVKVSETPSRLCRFEIRPTEGMLGDIRAEAIADPSQPSLNKMILTLVREGMGARLAKRSAAHTRPKVKK